MLHHYVNIQMSLAYFYEVLSPQGLEHKVLVYLHENDY